MKRFAAGVESTVAKSDCSPAYATMAAIDNAVATTRDATQTGGFGGFIVDLKRTHRRPSRRRCARFEARIGHERAGSRARRHQGLAHGELLPAVPQRHQLDPRSSMFAVFGLAIRPTRDPRVVAFLKLKDSCAVALRHHQRPTQSTRDGRCDPTGSQAARIWHATRVRRSRRERYSSDPLVNLLAAEEVAWHLKQRYDLVGGMRAVRTFSRNVDSAGTVDFGGTIAAGMSFDDSYHFMIGLNYARRDWVFEVSRSNPRGSSSTSPASTAPLARHRSWSSSAWHHVARLQGQQRLRVHGGPACDASAHSLLQLLDQAALLELLDLGFELLVDSIDVGLRCCASSFAASAFALAFSTSAIFASSSWFFFFSSSADSATLVSAFAFSASTLTFSASTFCLVRPRRPSASPRRRAARLPSFSRSSSACFAFVASRSARTAFSCALALSLRFLLGAADHDERDRRAAATAPSTANVATSATRFGALAAAGEREHRVEERLLARGQLARARAVPAARLLHRLAAPQQAGSRGPSPPTASRRRRAARGTRRLPDPRRASAAASASARSATRGRSRPSRRRRRRASARRAGARRRADRSRALTSA